MYQPSLETLKKYASVIVDFALNDGKGIRTGEVVHIAVQTPGLPLAREVYRAVLKSGGHPLLNVIEDDFRLVHLTEGTEGQVGFFPEKYYRGLADTIDHSVRILADRDPLYLSSIEPHRIILNTKSTKPYREWLEAKEDAGKFTWTLCLYGTEGVAREAGMSLEECWEQIAGACFLNEPDPIATWKSVYAEMRRIIGEMNAMPIVSVHVEAAGTDLTIRLGENRQWLGGRGRNIPSFEIFTSPDWRGVDGKVRFDLPLYRYGQLIRNISLEIRDGVVVTATAETNEKFLLEMIAQKNADRIGEFSLTDRRFSRITKFMAETLFDENFGGRHGNMHLAVGKAYHDTCNLDITKMKKEDFTKLGFNDSPEHTDLIATTDRIVTAKLRDGSARVIYEGGEFRV